MKFPFAAAVRRAMLLSVVGLTFSTATVFAQGFSGPPRGPGGGFGPRGNRGLLRELDNEAVRTELEITPEQQVELDALKAAQLDSRDQFTDIFQQYAAAKSEEERAQVREQMRERFVQLRKKADSDAKAILNPTQAKRLEQLHLHHEGPAALIWESDLATEFGITEEQKKELGSFGEQRMMARLALGRDASPEDRMKVEDDWAAKYLSVLTPEQQVKWKERLGPAPVITEVPERQDQPVASSTSPAAAPATPPRVVTLQPSATSPTGPVASFSADSPADQKEKPADSDHPAASGSKDPAGQPAGKKKLSFNFRFAPWGDVLRLFAEEAGLSLDLNAVPPGTFNYFDKAEYTPVEALDILNGYLLPKGYCLLRRDDFLVCVSIDEPISPSLIPNVSADELDQRGKNELLTVIFPLEGVDVGQVAVEVNEIKGPQGKVVGLKATNSIMVTDIGANLRRIRDLLHDVTARGGPNDISFKSYPVKHIDVIDAEQIVRTLLGVTPSVTNVSAMNDDRRRMGDPRDPRNQQAPAAPRVENTPVRVTTDVRTNQLLVTATLAQHMLVEQALKTIDVEGDPSQFSPTSNRPFLKVYQVTSADAREVTKTINSLIPGIVVNEDARNGKIHIQATPEQHRQVESLIAQMDGLGGSRQMTVIPLSRLDPTSVATTLRSMFLKDGEAAPTVEADYYGQQLMIRGTADQITQIRTLLTQLGEDGTGKRTGSDASTARTIPLAGRDPQELIPLIQKMWNANSQTPIRVVTPPTRGNSSESSREINDGPRDGHSRPTGTPRISLPPPQTRATPENAPTASRPVPVVLAARERTSAAQEQAAPGTPEADSTSAEQPHTPQSEADRLLEDYLKTQTPPTKPQARAKPGQPAPEVNIVVMGDELFITSNDPAQLDQLEELLQKTMQALPPRITWTVFTLQVADATEAANMLKLLFPGTTVSASSSSTGGMMDTLTSGATSLGSSLRDLTGLGSLGAAQSLKVIPDNRLNALFVAGPAAQVREVEEMLKVLDATDLGGDSLRDKIARMIPVEHSSVEEVYNIVKDVYKTYIEPPRVQENNNPFAMLAGGGARGRGNEQQAAPAPKLAIGMDKTTSHLIVWADDALFQEVQALVESIDQASREARRTVRVVNLENTNSTVIQGALGSLMPQVKVSVTGSRQNPASGTSSTPPASTGAAPGSNSNSDQMRQFFEQRMRERMQQGGGGAPGGGGFGRGGFGGGGFGGGNFGGGNRGDRGRGGR